MSSKSINIAAILIFLFHHVFLVSADIENIDLNYTNPKPTYDELYADGLRAYETDNHQEAVVYFERAISDYRHELGVKAQCWIKCQADLKKLQQAYNVLLDGQLSYLHFAIKMKSCSDLCREKFMGRRGPIAGSIRRLFENREPYNYLQFSYFKVGEVWKSINAAFTYLEMHPDDKMMKTNIDILLAKVNKKEDDLISLEELPHAALYRKGEEAYEKGNFTDCVNSFEESLTLFFKEEEKCHAVCDSNHEKYQGSYSTSLFNHYKAILTCRQQCRKLLTTVKGRTSKSHFVPYYFHYLQYCYNKIGNVLEAAVAAESYLLLIPNDPIMMANLGYYKKQPSVIKKIIKPRPRAALYFKQFALEISLFSIASGYAQPHVKSSEVEELEKSEQELDAVFESVTGDILLPKTKQGESATFTIDDQLRTKEYRDQGRWKREKKINKLARSGDGYEHNHDNAAHPFTEKEIFKGVTVRGAVDAVSSGEVSIEEVELYVELSERARLLTQEYFDLPVRLNFAFTHLVCRHALVDEISPDEEHISHPLHSDNCVLNGDGAGTCPKRHPAYTWRDYSALLYLNEDFDGGEFIFANYDGKIQARLRPKCGRLVSFRSNGLENLHGVLGVKNGTRCALPIWFTFSNKSEDGRQEAEDKLQEIKWLLSNKNAKQEL
ncbi:prolyl 3-hydroxylase 2-like isoform X4 [Hydractinia symbiolongicarpus]|uniref:prolyl 3-hydroxylase 2-like isoform X4 n=1 Tax=Hydractinia symbiolongicarpus TaxID=13093 RepID=UPI00254E5FBD|nr:prolyl 3-hydroxylase 2-like isoform X4 [Hydractinia symbiolongicarpus]